MNYSKIIEFHVQKFKHFTVCLVLKVRFWRENSNSSFNKVLSKVRFSDKNWDFVPVCKTKVDNYRKYGQNGDRISSRNDGTKVDHIDEFKGHRVCNKLGKSVDNQSNDKSGNHRSN